MTFLRGMHVRARGSRFVVLSAEPLSAGDGEAPLVKLRLRGLEGPWRNEELPLIYPIDDVRPEEVPELRLDRPGRFGRFRLLHDAFLVDLAPEPSLLVGFSRSRLTFEPYQQVPALRALGLPRPRLLIADDVGLGKTIETGLILRELNARRRADRILIVCPPGLMEPVWQTELAEKFGFEFVIFDRDGLYEARRSLEAGANPWKVYPRVITSMDFVKRRDGAFRELAASTWDVIVVDETHHLAGGRNEDDVTDRHRLGRWLAEATDDCLLLLTATPHDGFDETFASLLEFLEPTLAPPGQPLRFERYRRHLVRRLKRHIVTADGRPKFLPRTVTPVAVNLLEPEMALHRAVEDEYRRLQDIANAIGGAEAEPIYLLATVLRKRAASARAALRVTLDERRRNIEEDVAEVEIRREHLRALRRGEPIPDDALKQLERDLHRGYLSLLRRLGQRARRLQDEEAALGRIAAGLDACATIPESKFAALVTWLADLHGRSPDEKVIIFSEYADTAHEVADYLTTNGYAGATEVLTGELARPQRRQALVRFASPAVRVLVATDAAGEGLNLQEHCHHLVHFDLPWNPNRIEQRNGRIDRYKQTKPPQIAFLYAQDTYDGEVLARLILKIENQIRRLGAVGDVLGCLQSERIEQWLRQAPENERAAVEEIDRQQDDLLNRASTPEALQIPQQDEEAQSEIARAEEAARHGGESVVPLASFVERAVRAAGGAAESRGGVITVSTPPSWQGGPVQARYRLAADFGDPGSSAEAAADVLHEDHPLVRAAVRWARASRFDPQDDHRLAYTVFDDLSEPDLLATFIVTVRDGSGHEMQRLEAVQVAHAPGGPRASQDREADLARLRAEGGGNVLPERLVALFGDWWQEGRQRAEEEARRRAAEWARSAASERAEEGRRLREDLERWDAASREAILGSHRVEYEQMQLLPGPSRVPPSILRRMRQHRERLRKRRALLDAYLRLEDPQVEPLGVLLRVPAAMAESQR